MLIKIEEGKYYRTQDGCKVGPARKINADFTWARWLSGGEIFEIVGLRPEDAFYTELVSEWSDDTPKRWCDLTDEEKGALLLAEHEGRMIQCKQRLCGEWLDIVPCSFNDDEGEYRVKPEPVREAKEFYWCDGGWAIDTHEMNHTHRITFDLLDGKPDCASIKMEEI